VPIMYANQNVSCPCD